METTNQETLTVIVDRIETHNDSVQVSLDWEPISEELNSILRRYNLLEDGNPLAGLFNNDGLHVVRDAEANTRNHSVNGENHYENIRSL